MEKQHIQQLEKRINDLHENMTALGAREPVSELINIIHRPGWTTIAEEAFVTGIVDAMHAQTKTLLAMRQVLLSGAARVALNPQPLPPKA